jgi:hypothetical protein
LLLALLPVLFLLVVLRVLRYAYSRIGIAPQYFSVLSPEAAIPLVHVTI